MIRTLDALLQTAALLDGDEPPATFSPLERSCESSVALLFWFVGTDRLNDHAI